MDVILRPAVRYKCMDLMQLVSIVRARMWLILSVIIITIATTTAISVYMPKLYTAQTDLIIDVKSIDPVSGQSLPLQMLSGYQATQVDVIKSHSVAVKVVTALKLDGNPGAIEQFEKEAKGEGVLRDWLAEVLLKNLDVAPSRESSVLSVSFTGADPEFAALVANAFAQAYISTALELTIEPARNTSRWFDEQLQTGRANLAKSQQNLTRFQNEKGIVSTDERLDLENARLNDLVSQMVTAQAQSMAEQARIQGGSIKNPEDLPEVLNNPLVQRLKSDVVAQEAKVSELSTKLGENNPNYLHAKEELKSLKARVTTEMQTVLDSVRRSATAAQQREAAMRSAVEHQKSRILDLKNQSNTVTVLASEVQNAQKAYDFAMQRFSESKMQSQVGSTNIVVLNPARPEYRAVKPRIVLNIVLAIVLGTILAIGLALVAEMMRRVVRSAADLKLGLDLPVLGVLSKVKTRRRPAKLNRV